MNVKDVLKIYGIEGFTSAKTFGSGNINETYKVVADEFLMSAGADFNVLAKEDDYIASYEYDKDYLVCEYLKKNKAPIIIDHTGRIEFEVDD